AMGMSVGDFSKLMRKKGDLHKQDLDAATKAKMAQGELSEMSAKAVTEAEIKEKKDQAAIGNSKALASAAGDIARTLDKMIIGMSILGPAMTALFSVAFSMGVNKLKEAFIGLFKEGVEEGTEAVEEAGPKVKSFMGDMGEGIKKMGQAASENWKGMLAFGAAVLLMGAAVAIAAWGVGQLVSSFKGFSATEILAITLALVAFGAMMVGLAYVLVLAAPALAGASVGLLAFGGAMLLMGAAIAVAASGIATLVNDAGPGLVSLVTSLVPFASQLPLLGLGFGALGVGMGIMATGAAALGLALKLISTEDLQAIAEMAHGFKDFAKNVTSEFTLAMSAIADFVDAIDDIGSGDVEVFASLRKEISPLLASPVSPGVGREMMDLSRAAMAYAKANARLSVDADDDAFVALVKALQGAIGGGG
ncbi:MAG: hypothetical protein VYB74_03340, partial [Cyanobacteriota bacterium]|nr:hypothetical protein [Cyanobacteriota bacterium]